MIVAAIEHYAAEQKEAKREANRQKVARWRAEQKNKEINDNVTSVTNVTVTEVTEVTEVTSETPISREYNTTRAPAVIPVGIPNGIPPKDKKTNKKDLIATVLSDRAEFFDRLWAVMPKRRGDSPKPFREAVAKKIIEGADPDRIEAGVRRYAKAEAGRDGEFRPMATTWINQERWEADWGPPDKAAKARSAYFRV